jgi:flagellar basal body-associated protein FliL
LAVVIFAVLGYFAASKVWGFPLFGGGAKEPKEEPAAKSSMVSLGQFMTNLSDNNRYIRVTVDLEIDSSKSQDVTEKTSELKTDVYALLRTKSFKELSGEDGLRTLQTQIKERFEGKLPGAVRNVFFSEFIVQ